MLVLGPKGSSDWSLIILSINWNSRSTGNHLKTQLAVKTETGIIADG